MSPDLPHLNAFARLRLLTLVLLAVSAMVLAGCRSSEEKAEDYYQSALTYMAQGDVDRALVELRNVFKYNGFHKEARQLYADTQLQRGEVTEAYSQYLRLIEQYPDTLPVRIILAELAMARGDWDEAERHGRAAIELAPEAPQVQAIAVALDYRDAVLARDATARNTVAARAEALLKTEPGNLAALRVAIDYRLSGTDPASALPLVEAALKTDPKQYELHLLRFRLLYGAGDEAAAQAELEAAFELFPEAAELRQMLATWYYSRGDIDAAEAFLRRLAGPDTGVAEGHVDVVRFLSEARGREAAEAELERLIAATEGAPQQDLYRGLLAGLHFEAGDHDTAILDMQTLLQDAAPGDQTNRLKLMLAKMLQAIGNPVGAREQVEAVIAADPGQVDALKMRAAWLVEDDQPDAAIVDLRAALDGAPRDPEILTLMADAHLRAGARDLAGERLALAVEVSNSAPEVTLRYADFLLQDGRVQPAETLLLAARRLHPDDLSLAARLADLWLGQQNWQRLNELMAELRALNSEPATGLADRLQAAMLLGQDQTEEGLAMLDEQFRGGDDRALALTLMTRLRAGDTEAARTLVDAALATRPNDPGLRLLSAMVDAVSGDVAAAEATLRGLVADEPQSETPARMLASLLISADRRDEAAAVLDTSITEQPRSQVLRLIRAGLHERDGDFEAALALYEAMYSEDSSNVIVANNLASLLADHRTDNESLGRAYAIARRLNGTDVPAFQDTFGWIEYRRGNFAEAIVALEAAAEGLPDDALVQVHLGLAYVAAGRDADATPRLERGLDLAGDRALPQFDEARAALERIRLGRPGAAPAEN